MSRSDASKPSIDQAPQNSENFDVISSEFQSKILPGITHWAHPKFFAYFPAITNFESILADMLSTSVSNPGFNVSFYECRPERWTSTQT